MAKTHEWDENVPAGSAQANTADDHFRRLRLEIRERMEDFVTDWSADPVVLDPSKIGNINGKVMNIHSSAFIVEPSEEADFEYGDTGITISNLANPTRASLTIPIGVTIKGVKWLVTNGDTAPISLIFGSVAFALGVSRTTICGMTTTQSGAHIVDSAAEFPFTHVTDAELMYYLSIDKGGGAEFILHGAQIIYDSPNAGSSL